MTPARINSVAVQQALALWNNALVLHNARYFAARLEIAGKGMEEQIDLAVRLAFGRSAQPPERKRLVEYAAQHGLGQMCRLLFNANEFMFVD
jgi:hypothetical protein